jgi:hypothetical protein
MIKSLGSWSEVSEAIATGKDVMVDPAGKRHKVTYRVQSPTKFIVKIINDLDVISNDVLTPNGISAITDFLNSEVPFTRAIGQLTSIFFEKKFIVYTVLKDGEILGRTKQKIQFSIENRLDASGKPAYPNIPAEIQFIDAKSFESLSNLAPTILSQLNQTAQQTTLVDPVPEEEPATAPAKEEGTAETKKERGKKFLYTMRTNSKLYLMEFNDAGAIVAKTQDNTDPNGTISYDTANKKVLWSTTLDDSTSANTKISKSSGLPLFVDSEITNVQDKEFFEKMFTDEAFRNKIIDEYEADHKSSEITAENLKNMLFYKDGKAIFTVVAPASAAPTAKDRAAAFINKFAKALDKPAAPSA